MSEQHTPAPWTWWTSNSWKRLVASNDSEARCVLNPFVSRGDGHPDLSVTEADMRLIAASPELLEALTELLSAIDQAMDSEDHVALMLSYAYAENKARAAIKKATN